MSERLEDYTHTLYHNMVALNEVLKLTPHFEDLMLFSENGVVTLAYKNETIIKFEESSQLYTDYNENWTEEDFYNQEATVGLIITSEADWNTSMAFLYEQEREVLAFVIALTINIIIERLLSKTRMEFTN